VAEGDGRERHVRVQAGVQRRLHRHLQVQLRGV
jgi:hypothetical protein